jgi:hypothetical protein
MGDMPVKLAWSLFVLKSDLVEGPPAAVVDNVRGQHIVNIIQQNQWLSELFA